MNITIKKTITAGLKVYQASNIKNIIFIPILGVILVNTNVRAEKTEGDLTKLREQNLIELEELETMQSNENANQNKSPYFSNFDEAILLEDDDQKEIRDSKTQEIGKDADLIFNIREEAKNNFFKDSARQSIKAKQKKRLNTK